MQGFSYSQLYSALQVWPLKSSAQYLASLNRIIFLGELRVIIDLDLDIFDVDDTVTVAPGATSIQKPPGSLPIAFTAGVAQGATSATLAANWTGTTGSYVVTFSDNEIQAVTLTNGQTTATWGLPMANAVTVNAVVNSQFVVERNLWAVYGPTANADPQALCAPQASTYALSPLVLNGTLAGAPPLAINPPALLTATQSTGVAGGVQITITGTDVNGNAVTDVITTVANSTVQGVVRFSSVSGVTSQYGSISSPTVNVAVGTSAVVGQTKLMVKRAFDFLQMYLNATPGIPKYFADHGTSQWLSGPPAGPQAIAIKRRYIQRPPSIVVAQNTWIGDNQGQLLFAACLMESEQWLKADDRYGDMKTKYYEELLPNARGEVMLAARSGVYAPLAPIASVPGPPAQAAAG